MMIYSLKIKYLNIFLDIHSCFLTVYGFIFAFITYFCMYAYRKPYTALSYDGEELWGINFKTVLITVQTIGYLISKILGIKFISELSHNHRGEFIILLITLSEVSLLFFPIIPTPYSLICLFFNGMSLGMIWGIVYSFLEGRRTSEILGSGMAVSFIISSGAVKSIGTTLVLKGIPPKWMPATVGAIFFPVLLFSTFMLIQLPPPNQCDIDKRSEHTTMDSNKRKEFCLEFAPGIVLTVLFYIIINAFREFRDNFAPELWTAILGNDETPQIYTTSELCVAVIVVIPIGLLMFLHNNLLGYSLYYIAVILCLVITGFMTVIYHLKYINGTIWMVSCGVGIYIGYIPFNSIIFDRMIAVFHLKANAGFLTYICDAFASMATIVVMLIKNFVKGVSWIDFTIIISYVVTIFGIFDMFLCLGYYLWKYKKGNYKNNIKSNNISNDSSIELECEENSKIDVVI